RVLRHLDEHRIAGAERGLDAAGLAVHSESVPVDLTGVEHGIAPLADVDEGRFHARQHVLDLAEVDVSDQRGLLAVLFDVVFDGDTVLDDHELGLVTSYAHVLGEINGFLPGYYLGLVDDGTPTSDIASLLPSLPL